MSHGQRPALYACFALLCGSIFFVTAKAEETRAQIIDRQKSQQQIKDETERTARRINNVLRMLAYYKIDNVAEKELLRETADGLGKLSREQMVQILAHLDAQAKAPDAKAATEQEKQAYEKHKAVVSQLRSLLNRFDAIHSLDQAAERLELASRTQHNGHLSAATLAQEIREGRRHPYPQGVVNPFSEQAERQVDVNVEVAHILTQLEVMQRHSGSTKLLTDEQKERLEKSDALGKAPKLKEMGKNIQMLLRNNNPAQRLSRAWNWPRN